MTEQQIQTKIINYMKEAGIYYVKTIAANKNGTPDLLVCINGRFVALEVKQPGKLPTKLQQYQMKRIRNSKGVTYVVDDADTAIKILSTYKRRTNTMTDLDRLKLAISKAMGLSPKVIESDSRETYHTVARHIFMWFAVKFGYTYQEIATAANKTHHTTVMHAFDKIHAIIEGTARDTYDKRVIKIINDVKEILDLQLFNTKVSGML